VALPYDKLEVPLGLGIQTDIDDKLLPAGKVVRLENGIWERAGEILKRNGSTLLGAQNAASTPVNMPPAWQLATHKGALVTLSETGLRNIGVYSPTLNKWPASAGTNIEAEITGVASKLRGQVLPRRGTVFRSNAAGLTSLGLGTARVTSVDVATDGTYAIVCWLQSNDAAATAAVKARILELSTGKTLYTFSDVVTHNQTGCRVAFVNSQFQLVVIDGVNVEMTAWTIANIAAGNGAFSGPFTLATNATGGGVTPFDVMANGTELLVIYGTGTTGIIRRDAAGVITVSTLTSGGAVNSGRYAWMSDYGGSGRIAAIVSSSTQNVRVHWDINTGTGVAASNYLVDGTLGAQVTQLAGHTITNSATGQFVILYTNDDGTTTRVQWGARISGVLSNATWIWSATLGSKTFYHASGFYAQLAYESNEQGTMFTVRVPTVTTTDTTDGNRTPSAKAFAGSIGARDSGAPPAVTTLPSGAFLTAAKINVRLVQVATAPTTFDTGVDMLTLTFNPANVNTPREFADSLYVCGGVLGAFDGQTFAEEGFHLYPEAPAITQQASGSLTLLGNYSWCLVYRYTDEFGRIRRSRPSAPTALALTGGNQGAQLACKTLKFHGRPGKVVIEAYRTRNNVPDLFQLAAVAVNVETADTVTIVDTSSDDSLDGAQDLYTGTPEETAQLANDPAPAALSVAAYKDRLAVIDADDPTRVLVSFPLSEIEGPRFSDASAFRVDDGRGDLVGHAAMDDRLVEFKDSSIYVIQGDGPDTSGNGTFGLAQIIASGIGCSEPRSIVQTPDGIMFRSASTRGGICMVNRGLAVDDQIGKPVQTFLQPGVASDVGAIVMDAVHLPEKLRTEFFLSTGVTLAFDHVTKLWSTFITPFGAAAATAYEGRSVYQRTAQVALQVVAEASSNDETFDDSSSPVEMYVETPHLSLARLKGYLRFNRIQLVGEQRIPDDIEDPGYKLTLTLYKDFSDVPFVTVTRNMLSTDDINAVELRYSTKVSALKVGVRISQRDGGGVNFFGPKLSAIAIYYATKVGLRKTASGNRLT
jgi:hypothetical protein